jgi:hypothetical protein
VIRLSLLLNGIFCLLGGVGYAFDIVVLILIVNFGMGGAVLISATSSCVLIRRMGSRSSKIRDIRALPLPLYAHTVQGVSS